MSSPRHWLGMATSVALTAVSCSLAPQEGQFTCQSHGDCPPAWRCNLSGDGHCYSSESAFPAGPDRCANVDCSAPTIRYVDRNVSEPGDGRSWTAAFATVHEGLEAGTCVAVQCGSCEVWVAEGTYHVFRSQPEDTLRLAPGVRLYGGFTGSESTLGERDWQAHRAVLDGHDGDGDHQVHHVVTGSDDAVLDGFTITGGHAQGDAPHDRGGGMFNDQSSPTIDHCIFSMNVAAAAGGGMYNHGGSPAVAHTTFELNRAVDGAAMHNDWSSLTVSHAIFTSNEASSTGGAICNHYSSPTITNTTVFANNAQDGGGMFNYFSSPTVTASLLSFNAAQHTGGAMRNDAESSPALSNCVIDHNSATHGAGLYNSSGSSPHLNGCTLANNTANERGGGIRSYVYSSATITNCVLWDNLPDQVARDRLSSTVVSYSTVQDWTGRGAGNRTADPLFQDPDNGDYHLTAGSPCIDAAHGHAATETDIDGESRRDVGSASDAYDCGSDVPPACISYADMGAYEYLQP